MFNILRSEASLLYFASVLCPGMGQKSPHINRFVLCDREHYIGIGKIVQHIDFGEAHYTHAVISFLNAKIGQVSVS